MRIRSALPVVIGVVAMSGCDGAGSVGVGLAPPIGVGAAQPKLLAEGWLNGTIPSETELEGKVLVVDVWAYW